MRAAVSPSGPAERLLHLITNSLDHDLVLSQAMLVELRRVLSYPRLQARRRLTPESIDAYARYLEDVAEMIEPEIGPPVVLSDPDDDVVLYTALTGDADVLCTLNSRDFSKANVVAFCAERGLRLMTDVELLRVLNAEPGDGEVEGAFGTA